MKVGHKTRTVILQPRDRRLLDAIADVGLIDREQASQIGPFQSPVRANARLLALTQAALLVSRRVGTIAGGRKSVYALSSELGKVGAFRHSSRLASALGLRHQLAVSDLYVAARFPKPGLPASVVSSWRKFTAPITSDLPLIPDGFIELQQRTWTYPFFIEIDRGTESLKIWRSKVGLYIKCATLGIAEAALGIRRFGVLVVTESRRRLSNLREVACSHTSRLFWFTTQKAIKSEGFWSSIWLRPSGKQEHSLIQETL